jgi:HEAT repeat protein
MSCKPLENDMNRRQFLLATAATATAEFGAFLAAAGSPARADSGDVGKLIAELQSHDDNVLDSAWQGAAAVGSQAVKPLAALIVHQDFQVARSAKRALWKIVRHAGRPRAGQECKAVQAELLALLDAAPAAVRREALWMLSEIGDDRVVEAIARLLADVEVHEDARCALERMPGAKAIRALERALRTAPEGFRPALANSLRVRGRAIRDYPSQKLKPSRQTLVEPKQ